MTREMEAALEDFREGVSLMTDSLVTIITLIAGECEDVIEYDEEVDEDLPLPIIETPKKPSKGYQVCEGTAVGSIDPELFDSIRHMYEDDSYGK